MTKNILSLFQLCDSNFPTGSFSHSYGLETFIQEGRVNDQETFVQWLEIYLNEQLIYSDGLACHLVYEALSEKDMQKVWMIDRKLTVQNLPRETREGTQRVGQRMLKLVDALYTIPELKIYGERIRKRQSFGHPAIVFTMVCHHLEVSPLSTTTYYLYSAISSLVQNAVRAIPLGQTIGQQLLLDIQSSISQAAERIQGMDGRDFGIVSPGLELAQMIHEHVNIRIFMS